MIGGVIAVFWLGLVATAALGSALLERRARVAPGAGRPDLAPPRAIWGGAPLHPPARSPLARALADFARAVRSRGVVPDRRAGLRGAARGGVALSLASALALLPFAGAWGGSPEGRPLVVLDMRHGLLALALLLLLASFSRVALGLSDRQVWSRLASVRQAGLALAGFALFVLVASPLALAAGSLRLQDIALAQAGSVAPLEAWIAPGEGFAGETLRGLRWPAWNLFLQPITALLFVPAMALLPRGSGGPDARAPGGGLVGFDLDASPGDLYWSRLEARAARLLGSALFVVLFLGAGSLPGVDPAAGVAALEPYLGEGLPRIALSGLAAGAFLAKWLVVLALVARLERLRTWPRSDRATWRLTRRWLPLAWANLLLVAAWTLRVEGAGGALP